MASTSHLMSQLFCSISGEICSDPVVTPSGFICERRLLVSKLADTCGRDPFDVDGGALDESELRSIKLPLATTAPPPRPPNASSFSNLLEMIHQEHDALLLELFDTRKALEETRMELSQALYQNDAAVRVIARLALERDEARQQLAHWSSADTSAVISQNNNNNNNNDSSSTIQNKTMTNAPAVVAEEDHQMELEEKEQVQVLTAGIPQEDVQNLVESWKHLSDQRKQNHKKRKHDASVETVIKITNNQKVEIKSIHKSNKPGIVAFRTILHPKTQHEYVLSEGIDKTLVIYNQTTQQIIHTLHNNDNKQFTSLDVVLSSSSSLLIGTADTSGMIQVFKEIWSEQDNSSSGFELVAAGLQILAEEEDKNVDIVNIFFHPMGHYLFASLTSGKIAVIKVAENNNLEVIASFPQQQENDANNNNNIVATTTASGLHPDGLIFCVGKADGTIQLWDLKTQSLATTIETASPNTNNVAVTSLAFSDNGYHFASSLESGEVKVWDLRKVKLIATLNTATDDEDKKPWVMDGPVRSIAFDPLGKYLSYSSDTGHVRITTVKGWGETAMFSTDFSSTKKNANHLRTIIAWGPLSTYIVAGCNTDRSLKLFYDESTSTETTDEQKVEN